MLISCIMPTADRHRFVPHAVNQFLAQTYKDSELIVLDNGERSCERLVREHPQVKYFRASPRELGHLRNQAITEADGVIISHWDDDDLHHPEQLEHMVNFMLHNKADVVGIDKPLFLDVRDKSMWSHEKHEGGWVHGSALMYKRELATKAPFHGHGIEDRYFVRDCVRMGIVPMAVTRNDIHVNLIHDGNVSPKHTEQYGWQRELTFPMWVWKAEYHEMLTGTD